MLGLIGSGVFTMTTTLVLAMLERNGRERIEARIGATYAFAAAATILFLAADPHGDAEIVGLLKGDILATTSASLNVMTWIFAGVVLALFAFRKELLLVSFDRDLAVVFGKRVGLWDVVLYLLIGAVISLGVMAAGPLATFGFLVIPPLTMRLVTRRMLTFSLGSAALGGVVAFVGFYLRLPLRPAAGAGGGGGCELRAGGGRRRHRRAARGGALADGVTAALWICFALSGAAALALEMLWMRSAGLVIGQTAATAATVLACYFAGLGGGAAAARGIVVRPVRAYGRLELGAAGGALWSFAVFHLLTGDDRAALARDRRRTGGGRRRRARDAAGDALSGSDPAGARPGPGARPRAAPPRRSTR